MRILHLVGDQMIRLDGKKIVNHLMHPSRVLSLGRNLCFMNHLQLLVNNEHMSSFDNGLQQPDIERRDCMDWESTQRLLVISKNNKKRSHSQLDSRKQVIAFQDRVMTINIKEAQHPLK